MSIAFDETGRPFIILREQDKKKRVKGIDAVKVCGRGRNRTVGGGKVCLIRVFGLECNCGYSVSICCGLGDGCVDRRILRRRRLLRGR